MKTKTVIKSIYNLSMKDMIKSLMEKVNVKTIEELFALYAEVDKLTNGNINKTIRSVSMAKQRGEDVSKILTPGDLYRKMFGECFTPAKLINDMLDKIPADVWKRKDYKWIDNSVGGGNFPMEVLKRLMVSLKDQIPNDDDRKRHIIENMLYFVDMQAKNVWLTKRRLGCGVAYKFNGVVANSLEFDYWGGMKFDVIIGNPPYKKGIDLKFLDMMITNLGAKHIVLVHPSTYLIDLKGNGRYNKIKKLLDGKLKSATLFNGNTVFDVGLFVPCVVIHYDNSYNGKCAVEYFDQKFEADVWNITKFGKDWFDIVKPFMDKMEKVCAVGNDVWSHNKESIDNAKVYCQFAAIRGHVNLKKTNDIVTSDFYTVVTTDIDTCKGIRMDDLDRPGNAMPTFSFDTENERDNFLNYCKTFFARFCLTVYKNGQNTSLGEMSLIPWLDFTQSWDDAKLFNHFNIDKKTQEYIYNFLPDYYNLGKP